jgi:hypothetical protein
MRLPPGKHFFEPYKFKFMSKTVFVAGKVSGLPENQVRDKFERAAAELEAQGYVVLSPINADDKETDWEGTLRNSIKTMLNCDEVHLLPCWQESRGAQLERDIALRLGMNVVYH